MRALLLLIALGLCAAVPTEQGTDATAAEVDAGQPEQNPGEPELFEGDIRLEPGENPLHKNALRDRSRRWPNGVIPFAIDQHYPSPVKQIFHDAMNSIMKKTKVGNKSCIHFKPHHGEKAFIKFMPGSAGSCHSSVGYIHRRSDVYIGHGCEKKGIVMHELLHVLGFWHEQSRPDRDHYVTVHTSNILSDKIGNFNKYTTSYVDTLGQPYDYHSIMHYGKYYFAKNPHLPTLSPKQHGVNIGQRSYLSAIDQKEIQLLVPVDTLGQPYDYHSIVHYGKYYFAKNPHLPTLSPKQHGVNIGQRSYLSAIDQKEIQLLYGCIHHHHSG